MRSHIAFYRMRPAGHRVVALASALLLLVAPTQAAPPETVAKPWKTLKGHSGEIGSVAISADGRLGLSDGLDKTVRLWDLEAGKEILCMRGHEEWVYHVAFAPDGRTAVSTSEDNTIRIWDLNTGKEIRRIVAAGHRPAQLALFSDGSSGVTIGHDRTVRVWDLRTGLEICRTAGRDYMSLATSRDNRRVLLGTDNQEVYLWDLQFGKINCAFRGHLNEGERTTVSIGFLIPFVSVRRETGVGGVAVALSADGKTAASGNDSLRVWDLSTGKEKQKLIGHTDIVSALQFTPKTGRLLSASHDGTIRLWDAASGKQLQVLGNGRGSFECVAIAQDEKMVIASGPDGKIRVWRLP